MTTTHVRYPMPRELLEAGGRPAKSGKRYKSLGRVRANAQYLNNFGVQSGRYEWRIAEHEDGTFELYTFTRTAPKPGWSSPSDIAVIAAAGK